MTLNDKDLFEIAYLLAKTPTSNTSLAERIEQEINKRLLVLNRRRASLDMLTELLEEAKKQVNSRC